MPAATLHRRLDAIRCRLLLQRFIDSLSAGLLVAGSLLLVGAIFLFLHGSAPIDVVRSTAFHQAIETLVAGIILVGLTGLTSRAEAAAIIDRRAATHDRFHTALEFSERRADQAANSPLELLTIDECTRYIEGFPVRRWMPLRLPRSLAFIAVPLISLAFLCWHASLGIGRAPRDAALDAAVARRADALQKIADTLRPVADKSPEVEKVAEAMKRSAQRLKDASNAGDEEKLKTALAELSSLEAMLNAMKEAAKDPKISPAELDALAAALAATPPGRDAADSIEKGELEKAAAEMEKLLQQLQQQGDASKTLQQLAQSMKEQAAKLSEEEKSAVAQQMEQAAQGAQAGNEPLSQQALQRLADLLRKAGQNGAGRQQASNGSQGKPMTSQQMQDLLNALENMKDGLQQPGEDGQSPDSPSDGQGQGQSLAMVESFAKQGGADTNAGDRPSGMPGGEHDAGHPDKLFGETAADAPRAAQAHRLEGILGNGDSLQELIHSPSGPAKAGRKYRDLYEAMAPAAQNTVEQENIPLGSRSFVRRYFENIRPKD